MRPKGGHGWDRQAGFRGISSNRHSVGESFTHTQTQHFYTIIALSLSVSLSWSEPFPWRTIAVEMDYDIKDRWWVGSIPILWSINTMMLPPGGCLPFLPILCAWLLSLCHLSLHAVPCPCATPYALFAFQSIK